MLFFLKISNKKSKILFNVVGNLTDFYEFSYRFFYTIKVGL